MGVGEDVIEEFTPESLVGLRPIAEKCFQDFRYPGKFSWESLQRVWTPVLETGDGHIFRIGNKAVLGMMIGPDPFNGWRTALVNFWFVDPDYRHLGYGKRILNEAITTAAERGCKRMLMGHPVGHMKFFQQMGFTPIEVGFQKIL